MINNNIKANKKLTELITLLIFVCLIISIFYLIGLRFINGFSNTLIVDSWYYYQMSFSPFTGTTAPYTYRILTPFLVSLLPLNHIQGFVLINLTANGLTAIVFYYYLKKLEFSRLVSLVGMILLLLTPSILYTLFDIALVDSISFLVLIGSFYAILIKNDYIYFFMVILGIFNKEVVLLSLPVYLYCKFNEGGLKNAMKWLICILIPVAMIFISLRYFFGFNSYYSIGNIQQNINYHLTSNNILNNPYLAFGTLWIIFAYCLKNIKNKFLKKSLITLPFIFLQLLIATDSFRVLFNAFPIIIPISLYVFSTEKKTTILILMFISFTAILIYCALTLKSGIVIGYLILPLEIFLSICLFSYYIFLSNKSS